MPRTPVIPAGSAPPLEAAGGTLDDVDSDAILRKDLADPAARNEAHEEFFGTNPPARDCLEAKLVTPEFLVEISSLAHLG